MTKYDTWLSQLEKAREPPCRWKKTWSGGWADPTGKMQLAALSDVGITVHALKSDIKLCSQIKKIMKKISESGWIPYS